MPCLHPQRRRHDERDDYLPSVWRGRWIPVPADGGTHATSNTPAGHTRDGSRLLAVPRHLDRCPASCIRGAARMTNPVSAAQRFTARTPCPICGGHKDEAQGHGKRCWGFLSDDRLYARCMRAEFGGALTPEPDGGYV